MLPRCSRDQGAQELHVVHVFVGQTGDRRSNDEQERCGPNISSMMNAQEHHLYPHHLQASAFAVVLLLGMFLSGGGANASEKKLEALAWPEATRECRPWTRWWWLGSAVDQTNLTRLLTQYQDAGLWRC